MATDTNTATHASTDRPGGALRSRPITPIRVLAALPLACLLMAPRCYETQEQQKSSLPTYYGSFDGIDASGTCQPNPDPSKNNRYNMYGHRPITDDPAKKFPLFVYLTGTTIWNNTLFEGTVPGSDGTPIPGSISVPKVITEQMAARGFIAVAVGYDSGTLAMLSDIADPNRTAQTRCLFDASIPNSMLAQACQLPGVDCDLGIALWGHSQGADLVLNAGFFDGRVRAVVAMGIPNDIHPYGVDSTRIRVLNAVGDLADNPSVLDTIAGITPAECPGGSTPRTQCLRSNGSGWVRVPAAPDLSPSHCWFMQNSSGWLCSGTNLMPAPGFVQCNTELPYTLVSNADWLQRMAYNYDYAGIETCPSSAAVAPL